MIKSIARNDVGHNKLSITDAIEPKVTNGRSFNIDFNCIKSFECRSARCSRFVRSIKQITRPGHRIKDISGISIDSEVREYTPKQHTREELTQVLALRDR